MAVLKFAGMQTAEIEAAYQQGYQYRCNGQYRMAKTFFQQVLAQDPQHLQARWQMALILGFEGDFEQSLMDLQVLTDENPDNVDILNDLGMTQTMLGMQDEACATFQKILTFDPMHENANRQVAYCD